MLKQRFIELLQFGDNNQKEKLVYLYNNWRNKYINKNLKEEKQCYCSDSKFCKSHCRNINIDELIIGIKNNHISEKTLEDIVDNYEIE